jgi:predicted transcriptional regulator
VNEEAPAGRCAKRSQWRLRETSVVPGHRLSCHDFLSLWSIDLSCENGSTGEIILAMDSLELLLHPIRTRIIHGLSGGQVRTTAELADRLPDVSRATVYRQVAVLVDGGILQVAKERRVRGAVERSYRLRPGRAVISREAAASMTKDQHREAFAAAMAVLVAEFNAYLDRPDSNPIRDSVGYIQAPLWLSRSELADLIRKVGELIAANKDNVAKARRPYLLSPIIFPVEEVAGPE